MEKAPVTIKSVGAVKYVSSIRRKSVEEQEKVSKAKRKKDPKINLPLYKIGDKIVLTTRYKNSEYKFVEIVDYQLNIYRDFLYYGIVLAVTDEKLKDRLGRLTHFSEPRYHYFGGSSYSPEPISKDSVKWKYILEDEPC